MSLTQTSINKITAPLLPSVYPRTGLFEQLDTALARPVVWVSGPAGAGKSNLVASYLESRNLPRIWYQVDEGDEDCATLFYYLGLAAQKAAPGRLTPLPLYTKEYQPGSTVFTRRYFENLFGMLAPSSVIVFDDYQEVGAGSQFHGIIRDALEEIPPGINVIVISRNDPPAALARLRSQRRIGLISWENLRLNAGEIGGMLQLYGASSPGREAIDSLLETTGGWLAGLVFMLERGHRSELPLDILSGETGLVFDYFASEMFDRTDPAIKDFLLKTAFLGRFTPEIAYRLTGNAAAGALLADLNARNYFTEKFADAEPNYQYHPLFKEFLQQKAVTEFSESCLVQIKQVSADILAEFGRPDPAAELYLAARDWDGFTRLVQKGAPALIAQGRTATLDSWISGVPPDILAETPWLLYWLGVCRFNEHNLEARSLFQRSLELFRTGRDAAGTYLAWSGIANSFRHTMENWRALDHWIAMLDEIMRDFPSFPSPQVELRFSISMYTSLVLVQNDHQRIAEWEERVLALLDGNQNFILRVQAVYAMLLHEFWQGNYAKMRRLLDTVRPATMDPEAPPLATIMVKTMEAFYYWVTAQGDLCRRAVSEGLATANANGIQFLNSRLLICELHAALIEDDPALLDNCRKALEAFHPQGNNLNEANYYFCCTLLALLRDDITRAASCIEAAETPAMKIGSYFHECLWHLGRSRVFFAQKKPSEALMHAAKALKMSLRIRSRNLEFMGRLNTSWFLFCLNDGENGLVMLRQAMALGREYDYVYCLWWDPRIVARLCVKALEAGIEVEYVRRLVRHRRLMPDKPPLGCDNWPWQIQVSTLGKFGIAVDSTPLQFTGKVQKKPIELLKALIALGGAEKIEGQLADLLWPEADGDTAKNSFKSTLHRLRQMIGHDDAILVRKGKLVIDPQLIWSDVAAFEQLLAAAQVQGEAGAEGDAVRLTEKALALYRGHFLEGEDDKPWAGALRARLRNKFVLNIVALGNLYQKRGERNRAVSGYLRGLEAEPQSEEIYRHLMQCHLASGLRAEAITTYRDCRLALAALGLAPSPPTEAIYKQALKD